MHIAPVEEWQTWTDMVFRGDSQFVFRGGPAPLAVADGVGDYWEPNVWMLHGLSLDA